ncbi:MAG: acyltransferase [Lachnospiraceae bacterium]|nr:acyltransferase [Lachnospiraceae bacterium]
MERRNVGAIEAGKRIVVSEECVRNTSVLNGEKERYPGLDGLRTYAILGIIVMHVLANGGYDLQGFIGQKMIPSFYNLVFLFMMVSAFGMCCGYYNRIRNGSISVDRFYNRRFSRIWPFFAVLNVLNVVIAPSKSVLYEMFANLTICFGLLPNVRMSVIGVGWTLGVIFVFYLLFPFFCYLMGNKKRAYLTLGVSFIFNILCTIYFHTDRSNIVYSSVYFVVGGLIYLNREKMKQFVERKKLLSILLMFFTLLLYFKIGENTVTMVLACGSFLVVALECREMGILSNPFTKFINGISFEMYLCHMAIYRGLEKLNLAHVFDNDVMSYITMCLGTVLGTAAFSVAAQISIKRVKECVCRR